MIRVSVFTESRHEPELKKFFTAQKRFTPSYYTDDVMLQKNFQHSLPHVILTVCDKWHVSFPSLGDLPVYLKRRWVHRNNPRDVTVELLASCNFQEIVTDDKRHPLISIFTSTFRSKSRILRPLNTLLAQTYKDWEWIIVDDTPDDDTFTMLREMSKQDFRIKVIKPSEHDGMIGSVKYHAAMRCTGFVLVELDHDDDLLPDCLERLVNAFNDNPDIDFIHSNWCEPFEENKAVTLSYEENWGFGWGAYYKQVDQGCWRSVGQGAPQNPISVRNLVCAPNHVRAWRADFYRRIGGHNHKLNVADDLELMIRSFLYGRTGILPELLYRQYRNAGGDNFTSHRNSEIQYLVHELREHYNDQIAERFQTTFNTQDDIKRGFHWSRWSRRWALPNALSVPRSDRIVGMDPRTITILMPTYKRADLMKRAIQSILDQTYPHWILYVIGDHCPVLEKTMNFYIKNADQRIRWWNLENNYGSGGAMPRNYGAYITQTEWVAYLDDDNQWTPDHLQTCVDTICREPDAAFVFASFLATSGDTSIPIVCKQPVRGRLDTSCIVHRKSLFETYGMWKDRIQGGYSHDFELFNRWITAGEKWVPTLKCTQIYNCETNGQTPESILNMVMDDNHSATTTTVPETATAAAAAASLELAESIIATAETAADVAEAETAADVAAIPTATPTPPSVVESPPEVQT